MHKVRLGLIGCGWGAQDLYAPFFKYFENGDRPQLYTASAGPNKRLHDLALELMSRRYHCYQSSEIVVAWKKFGYPV